MAVPRRRRDAGRGNCRIPADSPRALAPVALPRSHHVDADRSRHGALLERSARAHDRDDHCRVDDHRVRRRGYRRGDRRRRPHGGRGGTPEGAHHREADRSLHHLWLWTRGPPRGRGVPGGRSPVRRDRFQGRVGRGREGARRPLHRRAMRRRTKTCSTRASIAPRDSSPPQTPMRTTCTSSSRRGPRGRSCRSSPAAPTRMRPRSFSSRAPTASCCRTRPPAARWRISSSSRR